MEKKSFYWHVHLMAEKFEYIMRQKKQRQDVCPAADFCLDFQPTLQSLTCRLFVLIEGVSIDIERCRWLAMSQQTCHCCNIRAVCNK